MSATFDGYRPRRDGITIPTIAVWIALSLLVHIALLFLLPPLRKAHDEFTPPPLTAYLRPAPQTESPAQAQAEAPPEPQAVRRVERVPLRPMTPPAPVIALAKPATRTTADAPAVAPPPVTPKSDPPPPTQTPQIPAPPPAETDLSAYIASRKRARGEDAGSTEADSAVRGALNSTVLNQSPSPTFAPKKRPNGFGIFRIKRRGYDYAEFDFYGWNESFGRDWSQSVDVRKGNNSDIDIAVVRGIIEIIRRSENGDFTWYSYRLGRSLTCRPAHAITVISRTSS